MIPDDIDASLRTGEPLLDRLDDGFSPLDAVTTPTHPVEPEPYPSETPDEAPSNPTQLPVEPEFGPALPPPEPEDPGVKKPTL